MKQPLYFICTLLPEKLGGFLRQFSVEIERQELVAEFYLESDKVNEERRGKRRVPPRKGLGGGVPLERRERPKGFWKGLAT